MKSHLPESGQEPIPYVIHAWVTSGCECAPVIDWLAGGYQMKRIALSAMVVLALASPSFARADASVTLETLRTLHAAHAEAIRTLVIEEAVRTDNPHSAAEETHLLNRLSERAAIQQERAAGQRGLAELSDAEKELIAAQQSRRADDAAAPPLERRKPTVSDLPAEYMPVWRANQRQQTRQRHFYDYAGQRHRLEMRDRRDLNQLAHEFGIVESQRRNLDASRTMIITAAHSIMLNHDDSIATVLAGSTKSLDERLELLGIVPPRLLSGVVPVEISRNPDGNISLQGRLPETGQLVLEITLRAEDYRMTHMARYGRGGDLIREVTATDYRRVGPDAWAPFHVETTQRLGGDSGLRRETREVRRIELNPPLTETLFEPPSSAQLHPIDPAAWEAFTARPAARRSERE